MSEEVEGGGLGLCEESRWLRCPIADEEVTTGIQGSGRTRITVWAPYQTGVLTFDLREKIRSRGAPNLYFTPALKKNPK